MGHRSSFSWSISWGWDPWDTCLRKKRSALNPPHFRPCCCGSTPTNPIKSHVSQTHATWLACSALSDRCHRCAVRMVWVREVGRGGAVMLALSGVHTVAVTVGSRPIHTLLPWILLHRWRKSEAVCPLRSPFLENAFSSAVTGWLWEWGQKEPAGSEPSLWLHSGRWQDRPGPGHGHSGHFMGETVKMFGEENSSVRCELDLSTSDCKMILSRKLQYK